MPMLNLIEHGLRNPSAETKLQIARGLEVDLSKLFEPARVNVPLRENREPAVR